MQRHVVVRAVFCLNVSALLVASGWSLDYVALSRRLEEARTSAQQVEILKSVPRSQVDSELRDALQRGKLDSKGKALRKLRAMIEVRAVAQGQPVTNLRSDDPVKQVKQIKSTPAYVDSGVNQRGNWLQRALVNLRRLVPSFSCKPDAQMNPSQSGAAGQLFMALMWTLLGLAVFGFLIWAALRFRWVRGRRLGRTVLTEDEPERTADEWLLRASDLEKNGKYREAIRCLYLAMLVRFDEFGIARFNRWETNWEHLARIQPSPKYDGSLKFNLTTRAFDRYWYGMHPCGAPEAADFRAAYTALMRLERR